MFSLTLVPEPISSSALKGYGRFESVHDAQVQAQDMVSEPMEWTDPGVTYHGWIAQTRQGVWLIEDVSGRAEVTYEQRRRRAPRLPNDPEPDDDAARPDFALPVHQDDE